MSLRRTSHLLLAAAMALGLMGCKTRAPAPPVREVVRIPVPKPVPCTSQQLDSKALFSGSKDGVVVVEAEGSQGSGFVVRHQDGDTLLLTNSHVVGENRSVTLTWVDGRRDTATVVADAGGSSPQTDLALLRLEGIRGKALEIRTDPPQVGADVVALGAPKGLEFSLTRGVVSSVREGGEIIQLDAPINPGNSGGPVLDQTGCVIGIATFKLLESEGLNFAVGAGVIQGFLIRPTPLADVARDPPPPQEVAEADPPSTQPEQRSNCWFQLQEGNNNFTGFQCQVQGRTNSNGHVVHDIVEPNGGHRRSVVLWDNNTAEVFLDGEHYNGEWSTDSDGDVRVSVNGGVFIYTRP